MSSPVHLEHDWFPRPLPKNVVIGERSWCHSSYAFLHYQSERPCGVRIGSNSGIYKGSFFDLGPDGAVEIGDYCALVGVIINCNSRVVIGDYAFIAHEVVFADNVVATPHAAGADRPAVVEENMRSLDTREPSIVIGENCWIGARAVLLAGANVGDGAIVGAAAVVDFVVPPFSIVAGNPARIVQRIT